MNIIQHREVFVIRDNIGRAIYAEANQFGGANSLVVECWALRNVLLKAKEFMHIGKLIVEGDSQVLINAILRKTTIPWCILNGVEDIGNIAKWFDNIVFNSVFRETNKVVNLVANFGHVSDRVWVNYFPKSV